MAAFENAARELGIPADRIGLVKRNLELKHKLAERGKALLSIAESVHMAHQHEAAFDACEKDTCTGVRLIVKMTEAE